MSNTKFLEDRKVILKPVIKAGGMNPPGHDGHFMYTGTEIHFCLPYDIRKGRLATILTKQEQEFFEAQLDVDLGLHNKKDNFWKDFRIKIRKDDPLMQAGIEFDLSDPVDNLKWRVLKLQPQVAPDWASKDLRGEYRFALVEEGELTDNRAKIADKRKDAYIFLGKVEGSKEKMINFLRVYGKAPSQTATINFLKGEIDKLIENPVTIDKVLEVINDADYEMKLFIEDAVDCGAIVKKNRKYNLQGGDPINANDPSLTGTVSALKKYKKETDDIYLRIESQIKNSTK